MVTEAGTFQASPRFVHKFYTLFPSMAYLYTDYLVRELVSLTKGGVEPASLSPMRKALREGELRMVHVIAVLCFISRMRFRDLEPTNGIHFGPQMFMILHRFFASAAMSGMVSDRCCPRAIGLS